MYVYISIVLGILFLICIYIIINLYKKNTIQEEWILNINTDLNTILDQWKEIDSKQMFEKDDDVGSTYDQINTLVTSLNEKVEN
tara:strand:+ start:58 stop:309 length:252 start_codon:yes stop_codon:yes gene_type:complete